MVEDMKEDLKEEANAVGGDASKPVGGVVRGKQFVPKKKDHEIGMCLACRMFVLRNQDCTLLQTLVQVCSRWSSTDSRYMGASLFYGVCA